MKSSEQWPGLWSLFGAFLNEDFLEEWGSPEAAIEAFTSEASTTFVAATAREAEVLAHQGDDEAERTMRSLGIGYAPWLEGWTCRGWLLHVAATLRADESP